MYYIEGDTQEMSNTGPFESFDEAALAVRKDGWTITEDIYVYEWENFDGDILTVKIVSR